jgi:hypothetical protein
MQENWRYFDSISFFFHSFFLIKFKNKIEQYRLTFKFQNGDRKLVRAILEGHGFREVILNHENV